MIVFTKQARELWGETNSTGNFSLWFNKYVPVNENDNMKVSYYSGKYKGAIPFYVNQYDRKKNAGKTLLKIKLDQQERFVESVKNLYTVQEYSIKLATPLVIGMGEPHPSENGMILDHNIGVPYIPASSVKGALRHAYMVNLIKELEKEGQLQEYVKKCKEKGKENDCLEEMKKEIPVLFGGEILNESGKKEETSGNIIVLDAYPKDLPTLQSDIMNNHYTKYYNSTKEKPKPPSDTEEPNPVKFISIKPGLEYRFYVLIKKIDTDKKDSSYTGKIEKAVKQMFLNGLGAKTATGYGRFNWEKFETERKEKAAEKLKKDILAKKEAEQRAEKERQKLEEERKIKEESERKERERNEAEINRLKNEAEEKAKITAERNKILKDGVEGFLGAKYFNELKRLQYITDDHTLSKEEFTVLQEVVACVYDNEIANRNTARKWKKRNDGNWKTLGTWIGGELKNKLFNEISKS